ncbi:MAG: hypothetical protein IJQ66_06355 [Clostridia bacterium]|nr:hypothetical protein [Clostridia bacterium]
MDEDLRNNQIDGADDVADKENESPEMVFEDVQSEEENDESGDSFSDNEEDSAIDEDVVVEDINSSEDDVLEDEEDTFDDEKEAADDDQDDINDESTDSDDDLDGEDDLDDIEDDDLDVEGKKNKGSRGKNKQRNLKRGFKIVPHEPEEDTNPSLKLYNEMVRHTYNYDESGIPLNGLSSGRADEIYECVRGDYPELFWLCSWTIRGDFIYLVYRCRKPNGDIDKKQIEKKLHELKVGSKFFTHGITRRTDPYKALITIYKRLILAIDYDELGSEAGIDEDFSADDKIRSLHSAIIRHKVVCAGYAAAMQYLLQQVGIPCAYVSSEDINKVGHAFNIVKIGKYCYYLDATWGDMSNTKYGDKDNDIVLYEYCCVSFSDFCKTSPKDLHNHIPKRKYYPWFKKDLKANRHEYYRYRKCFISRYNEDELVRIFVTCAKEYNPKEDGRFSVSFRCTTVELLRQVLSMIQNPSNYARILNKAKTILGKNKRAAKLFDNRIDKYVYGESAVISIIYKKED